MSFVLSMSSMVFVVFVWLLLRFSVVVLIDGISCVKKMSDSMKSSVFVMKSLCMGFVVMVFGRIMICVG